MRIVFRWNESAWQRFVGNWDLDLFVGGIGRDVAIWRNGGRHFESDPYWRLYFPLAGEFRLEYPDRECAVVAGHTFLVPPNQPFRYRAVTASTHYFLHFTSDTMTGMSGLRGPLSLECADPREERRRFARILRAMRADDDFSAALSRRELLGGMIAPFIRRFGGEAPPGRETDAFTRVLAHIDRELGRPDLRVEELARLCHLSRTAFSAEFCRRTGLPPKQYLSSRRISRAKFLLLRTTLSNREIARQCGYENEFFFYRIFQRYAKTTPGAYRRNNRFE